MASVDLSTTYLGLTSRASFHDRRLPACRSSGYRTPSQDAGCAAIVLHSLFEEQISWAESGRIHHLDPLDRQFAAVVSYFPEPEVYARTGR